MSHKPGGQQTGLFATLFKYLLAGGLAVIYGFGHRFGGYGCQMPVYNVDGPLRPCVSTSRFLSPRSSIASIKALTGGNSPSE